ncbi:MAG: hypothetical protein GWN00_21860, partial [Aliifodinibius sp.]|nr:hypothetical protein [Fodinibius sp.]NIV13928.1 hypothetical protein [Fodinibius sp.]NIY27350.1 hypothetical protein [Fodinibius sp.]
TVRLEGHTLSGNKLTFVTQNVTLDGQNEVTLDTPLARATRLRKNTDASIADGNRVYVYDNTGVTLASGVPDTPANVKIVMDSTDGTSFKAATAVSNRDYWMIKKVYADVNRAGATARCDIKLKVRQVG